MSVLRAVPVGCGHYLPERIVENSEFEEMLDTSDAWIRTRSGIERRHFAAENELTSDLAVAAAQNALERSGISAQSIDAIVVATATPDETFPSTATKVQSALGIHRGFAFDMQAVCAGFIYGLVNANALIRAEEAERILLIGAETFSRIMDWTDRGTCVLFGDGAGALILEAQIQNGTTEDRGILSSDLNSDGQFHDLLYVDGGPSSTGTTGHLRMQGKEVFRHAVEKLSASGETALERAGLKSDDVDWVVPHQANLRIIRRTAHRMGIPMDRVVVTVQDHGNTSAASIPLALSTAVAAQQIRSNDLILMEAIGGGLAWGAAAMRW